MITRSASTRVAEYAFQYARDNGRKRVTAVHKANIMKKADGLFIECVRDVSTRYPDIMHDEMIVDNTCMQARLPLSSGFNFLRDHFLHLQLQVHNSAIKCSLALAPCCVRRHIHKKNPCRAARL